ncbi:MAG: HAD family phosphatase [Lachnospiraceae bacterium]|nr:HAD family phosphatase [Lachnospiraceae bacterium]
MDKKILILDIDGTLVNSKKEITKKTHDALMDIQDMGHIVVLASGRPYPGMKQYVNALSMDKKGGYAIAFNGGMIIDCKTGLPVVEKCIPNNYVRPLYDYALDNGLGMVTYKDDMVITGTDIDNYMQYEARLNFMPLKKVRDFVSFVDYDMVKCLMTAEPNIKAPRCEMELKKMFSPKLNVFRSEPYFIEITTNGVDKSTTIAKLLELVDIPRENSICCGDGFNDTTMVKYAGIGVAMGNAQQIVKDNADYITASCDEDGLVEVIEKFIL